MMEGNLRFTQAPVSSFNPSRQLSTRQPLARSSPLGWGGESEG